MDKTFTDFIPLILYLALALGFSFLCSILEAVLLSVGPGYIQSMIDRGSKAGERLQTLKTDLDKSLSAVLTLNTIAHTMGAAGVGSEVNTLFDGKFLALSSAILTLLVLVLSEVIPKTLGARYCNALAKPTAILIHWLILALYPFVWMLQICSKLISSSGHHSSFSRVELKAIAGLAGESGTISDDEAEMVQNILDLQNTTVRDVMTPFNLVFHVNSELTTSEFVEQHVPVDFARIPLEQADESINSYVIYSEVLEDHIAGRDRPLTEIAHPLVSIINSTPAQTAFESMVENTHKLMLVVDEFGQTIGIVADEDLLESIVGEPIADETDLHASPRETLLGNNDEPEANSLPF
ncbi:MAG: hemolysin [Planctomycetaceae bacterium]|nr:hemolysin [Planctomycetaceae bacterium]|tara:strand:- start:140 stop:1195 length:1056 start_codon:yes stop_codon:yes gene_type:complete